MNSIFSDIIAVFSSFTAAAVFSVLLYSDLNKDLKAENSKQIGTVSFKKKSALRKYSKQAIWSTIEQNSPVYNNDSIKTEEGSEAVVHLSDGTDINMDENSLILFSQDRNKIDINFEQGSIFAQRSGASADTELNIKSGNSIIALESADAQISKSSSSDINMSVSSGSAKYITPGGEVAVGQNQMLMIANNSNNPQLIEQQIILNSPENNKIIISDINSFNVAFSHSEEENLNSSIEISTKRDFSENLKTYKNQKSLKLFEGRYFWRIKSKTAGGDIVLSETRRLLLIKDTPVYPANPANNSSVYFDSALPLINFRWSRNEIASSYILEISEDETFSSVIKSIQTAQTQIALDDIPEGKYYWRIKTKINIASLSGYESKSRPALFKVSKRTEAVPPTLQVPDNAKFGSATAEKNGITLSWKQDPSIARYEVVVTSDEAFSDIIFSGKTDTNYIKIEGNLKKQTYYWKVKEDNPDKETAYSEIRKFSLIDAEAPNLSFPANNTAKELEETETAAEIPFGWTNIPEVAYSLEISKDSQFLAVVFRKTFNTNSTPALSLHPGQYFWKVKTYDSGQNELSVSNVNTFNISKKTKLTVDMAKTDGKILGGTVAAEPIKTEIKKNETSLEIITKVRHADIYIDGKLAGKQSVKINAEHSKSLAILIKAFGYETFKQSISLTKDEKRKLQINLVEDSAQYRIRWTFASSLSQLMRPLITDKSIISMSENKTLFSHNFNGTLKWKINLDAIIKSRPVIYKNSIFIIDVNSNFYSIDAEKGEILWKKEIEGPILFETEPLLIDKYIYFATTYGYLYSFSHNGNLNYRKELSGGVYSSLAYYDKKDYLIAGTDQSKVLFLQRSNGNQKWLFETESRIANASPMISGNILYIPTINGTLYAVSIDEEKELWRFKSESNISTTPLVIDDTMFLGNSTGTFYALNRITGEKIWDKKLSSSQIYQPFLVDSIMYISAGNTLYSMSIPKEGKIAWTFGFDTRVSTAPSAMGNNIFVGLANGILYSLKEDIYKD
jgi:outer membrane protein assembly factor BamB